jgi:type II secretory pathway pseudopilin PulG
MKLTTLCQRTRPPAFTIVELLAVIAIIVALASLIFPITGVLNKKKRIKVAQAELIQVETAIEAYKARLGFYPPDNPVNPAINPLYFELSGTLLTNGVFQTLDGSGRIAAPPVTDFTVLYGTAVSGFANSSTSVRSTDDRPAATAFLANLRPNQIGQLVVNGNKVNALLVCSVRWENSDPAMQVVSPSGNPAAAELGLNPWRYISSNATNNPGSFDLWVDLLIAGKTNRISNWSKDPQIIL